MKRPPTEGYPEVSAFTWLPTHNFAVDSEPDSIMSSPQEVRNLACFRPEARLHAWRQALCDTFTELLPEVAYDDGFNGLIETVDYADLRISSITADAQRVHRGDQQIQRAGSNMIKLNVHIGGTGRVLHQAGATELAVGDCMLVDPNQPYVLEFNSAFRQLCIQIPAWSLREHLAMPLEAALGTRLSLVDRSGTVLRAALEQMLVKAAGNTEGNTAHTELFLQVLSHTLAECLGLSKSYGCPTRSMNRLIVDLRQYLGCNFRQDDISPTQAAKHLGCSVRNVHKICHNEGTTFGKLLLDARLSAVSRALAGGSDARISELAFESGFNDISHFNKVFRCRFGVSPTEFRRQRS
ncbi:MAG: helix-turn-helix domain-containing protein [Pseudomonadota bacterium]